MEPFYFVDDEKLKITGPGQFIQSRLRLSILIIINNFQQKKRFLNVSTREYDSLWWVQGQGVRDCPIFN